MKQMDKQGGLLSKWLSGVIRSKEEAQLDRQAKSDPFLQDALDGLRSFPEENHQARLDRLRQQLQNKEQKSAIIIPLYLRRIAAAVILVLGLTVIWQINRQDTTETLSMDQLTEPMEDENKQASSEEIPEASVETEANLSDEVSTERRAPRAQESLPPPPPPSPSRIEREPAEKVLPRSANTDPINVQEAAKEKIAEMEEVVAIEEESVQQNQVPTNYSDLSIEEDLGAGNTALPGVELDINGKGTIQDANGVPVPGAQIIGMNSRQQLFSDRNGQFLLSNFAQDSQVMIRHFNYLDTTIPFSQNTNLTANLMMDKNNTTIPNILFAQPYPEGGFDAFFKEGSVTQIASKKNTSRKRSNRVQKADIPAQEARFATIAFTISAAGKLSDFEVIESSNEKDGKAAIDRLKNGPKWVIPGGLDSLRTQITIPIKR